MQLNNQKQIIKLKHEQRIWLDISIKAYNGKQLQENAELICLSSGNYKSKP